MKEISTHDKFIILNGTLCSEDLWGNFVQTIVASSLQSCFSQSSFIYPDMTNSQSIERTASYVGRMLSLNVRTWVLGYSLGGIVALELARHYYSDLAGLILVCTNADGQTEEKEHAVERQLMHLQSQGLEAVFDDILLPAYFGNTLAKYHSDAETIKRSGMVLGDIVFKNQLKKLRTRIDQNVYLCTLDLPVLLVCGEYDTLCTPQQNKAMHAQLPNSTLYQCNNVGHALPLLRSEELAEQVSSFLMSILSV